MAVGPMQRIDIGAAQVINGDEIASAPGKAALAKLNGQQVTREA
jgi:hypothetical protein